MIQLNLDKYTIVILILDGCSVNALKKAKTPCIDELMRKGAYTLKCKSVYPTATYSAHSSIMTGVYPEKHGIVGNSFYDRELRTIVDFDVENVNDYLLSKTIFEEISGVSAAIGEPVSKGATITITKSKIQSVELSKQDEYAVKEAVKIFKRYKPLLTVINLPGVDGIGEAYGPLSKETLKHIEEIDELITDLRGILEETYDDYLLIVLSDHGMVAVDENVDLSEVLGELKVITCVSHRTAHIYTIDDTSEVAKRLLEDDRFEAIISSEELKNYHLENYRSGDFVVMAKEGYELGCKPLKGSHGGMSPGEFLTPLIVNKPEYADMLRDADITIVPKIVFRYLHEVEVIGAIRKKFEVSDPAHDLNHTIRVLKTATRLAIKYGADIEAVRFSCLFHDAERGEKPLNHEKRGALLAEKHLMEKRRSKRFVDKVKKIILSHHSDPDELETVEEKIVWDADKLDALGLVGLARCFIEAGFLKQGIAEAIDHYLKDVKNLSGKMHFQETRKASENRIMNALSFIKKLRGEVEGNDF